MNVNQVHVDVRVPTSRRTALEFCKAEQQEMQDCLRKFGGKTTGELEGLTANE